MWIFRGFVAKSRCAVCTKPPKLRPKLRYPWKICSLRCPEGFWRRRELEAKFTCRAHVLALHRHKFPSSFLTISVIPTAALDRVPVHFVFWSAWACLFFSPKHFKSQLIFLDRPRGDNSVGFFPPSINKASEKPTYYRVFSSGPCYLNPLGGLEEHKHIFQGHQLQLGELWAPAIVPSCQHVAWCHRAGGGTRGDDRHSAATSAPSLWAWTQLSLFSSFNGSFLISFWGWNCWLRGNQLEKIFDPKSLHFGACRVEILRAGWCFPWFEKVPLVRIWDMEKHSALVTNYENNVQEMLSSSARLVSQEIPTTPVIKGKFP